MATQTHGSKAGVLVNGYDLSPFLNTLNDSLSVDTAEETCFGPLGTPTVAKSYIPGLEDATVDAAGKYAKDTSVGELNHDQIADVLEAAIRANPLPLVVNFPFGDGFGNNCTGHQADESDYSVTAPVSSIIAVSTKFQASGGAEPLNVLHPLAQEAAAGPAATLDAGAAYAAASWSGLVAYLHVTAVGGAGPNVTARVQHSVDGTTWVDLATFTAVAAGHVAQRVKAVGTVNRYLRANWTIAAGTTATFHLAAGRVHV